MGTTNASRIALPRVALGTMTFGRGTAESEARLMIDLARDRGVHLVDTANAYGNGAAETFLGDHFRAGWPDDLLLVTKVGHPSPELGAESGLSPSAIRAGVEGSLSRLRREWIDVYLMHMPDARVPTVESLGAMHELVTEGKVRAVGLSNFAAWEMVLADAMARDRGWTRLSVGQQMYNLIARRIETEYLPMASTLGIATMAYNPLAGGLLAKRHEFSSPPESGRFTRDDYLNRYWNEPSFDAVARLQRIASSSGLTIRELALGWLGAQERIDTVVVGASSPSHLAANLDTLSTVHLDPRALAQCDEVWEHLAGHAPHYNR